MFDNIDKETCERIVAHINAAIAYDDNRKRKIHFPSVDNTRPTSSSRTPCSLCTIGIRPETTPVNGMHPRCARVHADPREALKMPVNGHAARALLDNLTARIKRDDDVAAEIARKQAHAELLARFEAAEQALESDKTA